MATTERQRQKKLEKLNKKRKLARKAASSSLVAMTKAAAYTNFPLHECLMPDALFDNGIGSLIVSRRLPMGELAVSAFVVDTYCLGVKNAFFAVMSEEKYEEELKTSMLAAHEGQAFERLDPGCMKKLITDSVRYAEDLGFPPHKDYKGAIGLLNDVDASSCATAFSFGFNGKPFYVRGPNESILQAKRIVERLVRRCAPENCHYSVILDELPPNRLE